MRLSARLRTSAFPGHRAAAVLACCVLLGLGAVARGATLVIHVLTADGHPLPGAVVTVHPLDGPPRHAPAQRAVMDQMDRAFEPDLLVIPVGSTIEFPNSDSVSHQIYSFSPAKRFQLPLYRGKPYPPVPFETAGVVTLGCNIHDQMLAYVLVTDAPYFGRTDASGAWTAEVTHGHYEVNLWHPRIRDDSADLGRQLTVSESDRAELTLRLAKPLQPAPLADRPHRSWDY
jgi:plastocyanin